jgi:5-methyltetrahydrofolate--homocysteine methyltransferase
MGTMLMATGLEQGECPEQMSLTRPTALTRISEAYSVAGADLIHTNTFGGSPLRLAEYGLEDRTEDINREAVVSARAGARGDTLVSGSVGPSGRILEPYGDLSEDEAYESFFRQATALAQGGVDAITVETMIDLREAVIAVRACRAAGPSVPVLATMTFQPTPRGFHTVMGTGVPQAAEALIAVGADVVGSNCGNGIATMIEVAEAFRAATDHAIMIQPNAGIPEVRAGLVHYPETPADFAAAAPVLVALGVSVIGGCCGTDTAHIRALRQAIDGQTPTP